MSPSLFLFTKLYLLNDMFCNVQKAKTEKLEPTEDYSQYGVPKNEEKKVCNLELMLPPIKKLE